MTAPTVLPSPAGERPRLYVVVLSHLDSQWRWTLRDTVRRYLPRTVVENDALFERYPRYELSFEGAWRYHLLTLHHPALAARVRERVAAGRWHPVGAALEAFDTLVPAPESILRQIHYGQRWFARELGRESADLFLPDCFGFPATLPTLAAHSGLLGFSTQKLRRGSLLRAARPIPFPFGRWRGLDGAEILAALDPGEYAGRITVDLSRDPAWADRFAALVRAGQPPRRMLYAGVGDRGGAPSESTLAALELSLDGAGPVEVVTGAADRIFRDITAAERARLPVHEGELLLRRHGTGCYTAKGALKRWNRTGERLARAAELAAALAASQGRSYPARRLERAWWALLVHQMHDDLTGTSIPAAYRISFAHQALAANDFAEVLLDSLGHLAGGGGDSEAGCGLLALNPLGSAREDVVESAAGARLVRAPALGSVRLPQRGEPDAAAPRATADALENHTYCARFDEHGALASCFDRRLGRELLAAPLRLELFANRSAKYPAWEILWEDLAEGPRAVAPRLLRRQVVALGPARAALEIERELAGCRILERWSLAAGGAGDRLECAVTLDARGHARLLKCAYPFALAAREARFDTGLGAVARPLAGPDLYEVPAQHWAALEDVAQGCGAAVLSDVRAGWDFPAPGTLRLTWLHAPRASFKWRHQRTQDHGRHRFRIALAGFAGGALEAGVPALADRFVHPLLGFSLAPDAAAEPLPESGHSLFSIEGQHTRALAAKRGDDDSGRLVLRLNNPGPGFERARIFPRAGAARAWRLDGRERELEPLEVDREGAVEVEIAPGGLATLGFDSRPVETRAGPSVPAPRFESLPLNGSLGLAVARGERCRDGGFDGRGRSFPAELLPAAVDDATVPFSLDPRRGLVARGQRLALPAGAAELWLLAASGGGPLCARFLLGAGEVALEVPDWRAPLYVESRWRSLRGLADEIVRRVPLAWWSPFLRDRRGRDLVVEPGMLFALRVPIDGARAVVLPDLPRLRIAAATLADAPARPVAEATPLLS